MERLHLITAMELQRLSLERGYRRKRARGDMLTTVMRGLRTRFVRAR